MLYAILCYNDEAVLHTAGRTRGTAPLARCAGVRQRLAGEGRLGPVARLMPTAAAVTVRAGSEPIVLDGPFAETREQLLGFWVIECDSLQQAIDTALDMAEGGGAL